MYYCFDEVIYQSPNSTLYRAFERGQSRQVVLKCFEADAQGMYLREMSAFGMNHPNLVSCLDTFYLADGRPCIVSEFFQAGTLENWLKQNTQATLAFCYRCLEDILQALIYLNQAKRIHCDIKPGNIFLNYDKSNLPHFILGDLGATCSLREAQESRYGVGTLAYMAPERLYERFSYNSDLYSLGVLAFELATGQRPFLGNFEEIKRGHLDKIPELDKILNFPLSGFIEGLLEKDPKLRIADANTALLILTAIQQGQVIVDFKQNSPKLIPDSESTLIPNDFKWQYSLTIENLPNKLLLFEKNYLPILGLDYENHLNLIQPDNPKNTLILKNGMTQIHQSTSFFYTHSLKVFRFDLDRYQRYCLYQFNKNIVYFQMNANYLLLCSKYENVYCHLDSSEVFKFSQSNYFSMPQAVIFANGNFCLSGGMSNQELVLRDSQMQILNRWQFQGPIIAITQAQKNLLVLTLDMQNSACYWLWHLTENQSERYIILSNQEMLHYCQTEGYFFWINRYYQLYMCNKNLTPQLICQLPNELAIISLQVTVNHHWLAVLVHDVANSYKILFFKAEGTADHD
jgi:serine/threonine protein kinase